MSDIIALLPEYPTPQMRTYIMHHDNTDKSKTVRGFLSPMLYLWLRVDNEYAIISFARNIEIRWRVEQYYETALVRFIYRNTDKNRTAVNIEGCLENIDYADDNYDEAHAAWSSRKPGYRKQRVKAKEA